MKEHPLRDIARQVMEIARKHTHWSQAQEILNNAESHLILLARHHEGNAAELERENSHDAQAMGRKGGIARAKSIAPERRAEIAKKAAVKRWSK